MKKPEDWEVLRKKLLEIDGAKLFKKRDVRILVTKANLEAIAKALDVKDPPQEVEKFIALLAKITKFKHTEEHLCTFDENDLRAFCAPPAETVAA